MDKYIRIKEELKKKLKIRAAEKDTNIKALAEIYILQGLKKEEGKEMKFSYNKEDFFDEDGWVKYNSFSVAVGKKGELEYVDTLKNKSYYEQNPYYIIVSINSMENDIQDDSNAFERIIKDQIEQLIEEAGGNWKRG